MPERQEDCGSKEKHASVVFDNEMPIDNDWVKSAFITNMYLISIK